MSDPQYYVYAFATFGHPNDFRQTPFLCSNANIAKKIKVFDLSNAIKVFPNSKIYSIRKERVENSHLVSYTLYTYAQEQTSKRDGTFIGSSIILVNKLSDEGIVTNCLERFHQNLIQYNLEEGVLKVKHSKDFETGMSLKDFDKIKMNTKEIENLSFLETNKNLVIFCETSVDKLPLHLKLATDLLNVYDTIYFTQDKQVAAYVVQKGIFPLIQHVDKMRGLENEIRKLEDERKRKRDLLISDFEKEIQKLDAYKNKTLDEFKEQIKQSEKRHQENDSKIRESKNDLERIKQIFDDFSSKIEDIIILLKSNKKAEKATQIYNENKGHFMSGIAQFKTPDLRNNILKANTETGGRAQGLYQDYHDTYNNDLNSGERLTPKINQFKVATFILSFLLMGTWLYFIFFNEQDNSERVRTEQQEVSARPDSISIQTATAPAQELNPKPNLELNENDYLIVAKKLNYDMAAEDIVKTIFDLNPTDIKSSYTGQEAIYAEQIIALNKNCFEERDGAWRFAKDTLRHIPAFKKEK